MKIGRNGPGKSFRWEIAFRRDWSNFFVVASRARKDQSTSKCNWIGGACGKDLWEGSVA
jgi:hypothetical protein